MSAVETESSMPPALDSPGPEVTEVGSPPSHTPLTRQRSRHTSRAYEAEGEALGQIAKDAEAKLALRRAARAEARDIRMKEIEKQQQEEENLEKDLDKEDKKTQRRRIRGTAIDVAEEFQHIQRRPNTQEPVEVIADEPYRISRRHASKALIRQSTTTSNHSNSSSRRGSLDSIEQDPLRLEYEEKYKKAMMTNAQLDNEKSTLTYEVEALKDMIEEQEEQVHEYQREAKEKHRELQSKKRDNGALQREVENLRELVTQRDELIAEHGLLLGDEEEDEDSEESNDNKSKERSKKNTQIGSIVVLSPEAAQLLEVSGDGPLDVRLKRFVEERRELVEQIERLKLEVEDAKDKAISAERRRVDPTPSPNGPDLELLDLQRDTARQANEYKFKLQRAEQEVATLESSVARLDGQVKRYKNQAETAEKAEEELKLEARKMKREIRSLTSRLDDLETENNSLNKRLEKMKKKDPSSFI